MYRTPAELGSFYSKLLPAIVAAAKIFLPGDSRISRIGFLKKEKKSFPAALVSCRC